MDLSYQATLDYYNQVEYGDTEGDRQWMYQTCTEFGWYQTSDQPGHPYSNKFPIDVKLEVEQKTIEFTVLLKMKVKKRKLSLVKNFIWVFWLNM